MASLLSVEYKIYRAVEHIKSLQSEIEPYFKTNPGRMIREPGTRPDEAVFRFKARDQIPARFGLIIGDCLQNLRSSLDYLVWELVLAAKNQPGNHNMFPICKTVEAFENALSKRKRLLGVHPDAIERIRALQPYHLGQDYVKSILWVLDELTNINKHRRILLTDLAAGLTDQKLVEKDGELGFEIGPGRAPVFDSDAKFGPYPIIDGKVHITMERQLLVVMAFAEGAAKGMEVSLCLNEWAVYIKTKVLPMFENLFAGEDVPPTKGL